MKVVFSWRALDDLRSVAVYTRKHFGDNVAAVLEARVWATIAQLCLMPESGPQVEQRAGTRVVALGRHPCRIFYRIAGQDVIILRIRHTARQNWSPDG